jgi:uncharacterized membrane protein
MQSKARIANHPLHPMLIIIPAGAFVTTLVFDVVYLITGVPVWWEATMPLLLVGVIGGLVAAIPGVVDLVAVVPKQNATRIGVTHMLLNVLVVALSAWNAALRWAVEVPPTQGRISTGFWLSLIAVALLAVSGWLGWKMVYEYHVGVLEHPAARDVRGEEGRLRGAAD